MRRRLCTASLLACAVFMPALARAQPGRYPQRPIRFIVPFAAGGGGDAVARILALR